MEATRPTDAASPSSGSSDVPRDNGRSSDGTSSFAMFGVAGEGQRFGASTVKSVRLQRDFAVLRQEMERKNTSISREIKSVVTQLGRLRQDEPAVEGESGKTTAIADQSAAPSKDATTLLVMELQMKVEEQQAELEEARSTLRSASLELDDMKASQHAELDELRRVRAQLADREADRETKIMDGVSQDQRVLELQSTLEEQAADFQKVHNQLNARERELEKVKDELAICGQINSQRQLEDDHSQRELEECQAIIEEQEQEIFRLKAQLVASDGLKAQLLSRNAELQQSNTPDKADAAERMPQLQEALEDQKHEIAVLKDQLFEKDLELKKLQRYDEGPSPELLNELQSTVQAQRAELDVAKRQISEAEARVAACSMELAQKEAGKIEELQGSLEDLKVELATTKAQLVTRNLELTKMEAQLASRNLELTKYEEQRAELASVKAQLMARDLKLMKQEVAMALTDAKSPSPAAASAEASANEKILQLEKEAAAQRENIKRLEDMLLKAPAEAPGASLVAEQLSELAADVLSRNEQLAEKQLSRARSFLEVLRGTAWAREATPSSFKLGKFLDDLAVCLELEAKKALGANKSAKSTRHAVARGNALTQESLTTQDTGRPSAALSSPAALMAPPIPEMAPEDDSTVKLLAALRRPVTTTTSLNRQGPISIPAREAQGPISLPGREAGIGERSAVTGDRPGSYPSQSVCTHSGAWGPRQLLESKLIDRVPPRLTGQAPPPTASSLGLSLTGTSSSLRSTEAALSPPSSGSTLLISGQNAAGVTASPTIYSAPDRDERVPLRASQQLQEA